MCLGTLYVETDWDFSLVIGEDLFSDSEFSVDIFSIATLNAIRVTGPFGAPSGGKTWEIDNALEAIRNNPSGEFSNVGGNRGATWIPNKNRLSGLT